MDTTTEVQNMLALQNLRKIGRRIRELREARKWTQTRLANELGVSQGHISSIELGKNLPTLEAMYRLASIFGVKPEDLQGRDEPPVANPMIILSQVEADVRELRLKLEAAERRHPGYWDLPAVFEVIE